MGPLAECTPWSLPAQLGHLGESSAESTTVGICVDLGMEAQPCQRPMWTQLLPESGLEEVLSEEAGQAGMESADSAGMGPPSDHCQLGPAPTPSPQPHLEQ